MKKLLSFLSIIFLCAHALSLEAIPDRDSRFSGNWENIGPKIERQAQGLARDVWVDPDNELRILAGFHCGGLWETLDGGKTWECISDRIPPHASIGVSRIAVNPFDKNEIYIATQILGDEDRNEWWHYGQGIWRTKNGGETWKQEYQDEVLGEYDDIVELRFAPYKVKNKTMLLALKGSNGEKILQKIGNGIWRDISMSNLTDFMKYEQIEFADARRKEVYLTGDHRYGNNQANPAKIYKLSHDSRGNISRVNILLDGESVKDQVEYKEGKFDFTRKFVVHYGGDDKLYVLAATMNLHSAAGLHALCEIDLKTGKKTDIHLGVKSSAGTSSTMQLSGLRKNPKVLYHGSTVAGKFWYDENNKRWMHQFMTRYNVPEFHADVRRIFPYHIGNQASGAGDRVYWCNDGGISVLDSNGFRNINGDKLYTTLGYDVAVHPMGGNIVQAAMHNSGQITIMDGDSMKRINGGDGFNVIFDSRFPEQGRLIYGYQAGLFRSMSMAADGHELKMDSTFTFREPRTTKDKGRSFPYSHYFTDSLMFLANKSIFLSRPMGYGEKKTPTEWYKISDNGGAWNYSNSNASKLKGRCRSIAVCKADPYTIYTVQRRIPTKPKANDGLLMKSHFDESQPYNYGWEDITANFSRCYGEWYTDIASVCVDPENPNRVWLSMAGIEWNGDNINRVWFSEDGGKNFSDQSKGLSNMPCTQLVYQEGTDDLIYAATDVGVYWWDSSRNRWRAMDGMNDGTTMPKVIISDMEIDYNRGKLVATTWGRGIWISDLVSSE